MKILGIDEAGRGCVIGPMVIAGVVIEEVGSEKLKAFGVKDSKQISSQKRKELVKKIKNLAVDFKIILHQPEEIDLISLNELDLQSITKLINQFQPEKAIFDVPTHPKGVGNFIQSVQLRVKTKTELIGENKADEKYPVVSAASILAKVNRDQIIQALKRQYGDFGSGYMSDQKTQQFLKKCSSYQESFPPIVRKKWSSVKKLVFNQQKLN